MRNVPQSCAVSCSSGTELLLLLRDSKHNNNTWGLPGGNVEDEDTDLLVTAKREAQEEMGSLPEAAFQNQILTKYASVQGIHLFLYHYQQNGNTWWGNQVHSK